MQRGGFLLMEVWWAYRIVPGVFGIDTQRLIEKIDSDADASGTSNQFQAGYKLPSLGRGTETLSWSGATLDHE